MKKPIAGGISRTFLCLSGLVAMLFTSLPVMAQPTPDNTATAMSANFTLIKIYGTNACTAKCTVKISGDDFKESRMMDFALLDGMTLEEMTLTPSKSQMIPPGLDHEVIVLRPDLKLTYLIFPRLKAYVKNALPPKAAAPGQEPKMDQTELGKETVEGHPCLKKTVTVTMSSGKKYDSFVWFASDLRNFPVRIQTTEEDSSTIETTTYSDVQFTKPDPTRFAPPAGFTEYPDIDDLIEKNETNIEKLAYLNGGIPDDRLASVVDFTLKNGTNRPVRAVSAIAYGLGTNPIPAMQIVLGQPDEPVAHLFAVSLLNSNDLFVGRVDRTTRTGVGWLTSPSGVIRGTLLTSTNAPVVVTNTLHADEFVQEVELFLEATAPPPWEDAPHPLNVASKFGSVADVEKILKGNIKHINDQDDEGMTPLANAVVQEQIDVVRLLLENGANPNIPSKNGDTPLGYAASRDQTNGTLLCELLLAKGAIVNPTNKTDYLITPLDWAVSSDNTKLVKILLDAGASVKAKNDNGDTPLHAAASRGDLEIAEMLVAHGADVNAKITGGTTPLFNAAEEGHEEIMKLLLSHGAEADAKRTDGVTPLLEAVCSGAERHGKGCVELLLAKGVDLKATDGEGETALLKAAYYGNKEVVELLIAKGAEVNATSKNGKTPLSVATKPEIKELLRQYGAKE